MGHLGSKLGSKGRAVLWDFLTIEDIRKHRVRNSAKGEAGSVV